MRQIVMGEIWLSPRKTAVGLLREVLSKVKMFFMRVVLSFIVV